jgi:hypothetical protein
MALTVLFLFAIVVVVVTRIARGPVRNMMVSVVLFDQQFFRSKLMIVGGGVFCSVIVWCSRYFGNWR